MADRQDNRSPKEIRRDIERTRADMHETVDALERKLSPGQLLDQVWDRFGKGSGEAVAGAAREHTVPLALVGAGLAWLAIEKTAGGNDDDSVIEMPSTSGPSLKDRVADKLGTAKDKAASAFDSAKDSGGSATDTVSDGAGTAKEKVGQAASRAKEATARGGQKAKRTFLTGLEEQPLSMGAIAFGLGLASGLSAPATRWENEKVGRTASNAKQRAAETARDVGESAKRVVKDTARAARDEADRQGLASEVKQSVKQVAHEAKETAKQRSREEDLHPGGLKERAAEAGGDVRDDRGPAGSRDPHRRP